MNAYYGVDRAAAAGGLSGACRYRYV